MMDWIRLPQYLATTGENRRTWNRLIEEGDLFEGTHYRYDNRNRVWVNIKAMSAWVEGKKPRKRRNAA